MSVKPFEYKEAIVLWRPPMETQQANNCTAQACAIICECYEHTWLKYDHKDVSVGYLYGRNNWSNTGRNTEQAALDLIKYGYVYREDFECETENPECYQAVQAKLPYLSPLKVFQDYKTLKDNEAIWDYLNTYRIPVLLTVNNGFHAVAVVGAERREYQHTWQENGKYMSDTFYADYKFTCLDSSVGIRDENGLTYVTRWQEAFGMIPIMEVAEDMQFKDVDKKAWYANAVDKVSDIGLMIGDENGNFRPEDKVTRAEMATILNRLVDKGMIK